MSSHSNQMASPTSHVVQAQPASLEADDFAADPDEPPEPKQFQKASYPAGRKPSLLTHFLHTSESESNLEQESQMHRAHSSASTYSRGSATSMGDLTSDGGHTSPRTTTPSPPIPHTLTFKGLPLASKTKTPTASVQNVDPQSSEKVVEAGLGRKRRIMFACPSKQSDAALTAPPKANPPAPAATVTAEPTKRVCSLKFACLPSRDDSAKARPKPRVASPAPVRRDSSPHAKPHRNSDVTIKAHSPTALRKVATVFRKRRESGGSDMSRTEATRFHEFASSEDEADDWTKESGCFQRRLTVDDTLEKENGLRKLGREAEEELEQDEQDEEEEDEEQDDDEEEEEEEEEDDDDDNDRLEMRRVVEEDDDEENAKSSYDSESDDGFHSDDEHGFARSDDEDDDSDNDWWTPGGNNDHISNIRPEGKISRRGSTSTIDSVRPAGVAIPGTATARQKSNDGLELPDSTDFVCGTLDEDKPLEQAFLNHLEQRRAAKHKLVPQDIDPTFPTSDPELEDEEEDEVSDRDDAMESDHQAIFLHGKMEMPDDDHEHNNTIRNHPQWVIPKKRSPIGSPKRLRSPPPTKKISLHRSPPPTNRRAKSPPPRKARSPLPQRPPLEHRISSSLPRRPVKLTIAQTHNPVMDMMDEDDDNTPRFNRRAIDIVMGLEKKRQRRREKLYKLQSRKAQGKNKDRKVVPGKGAEKMKHLGIAANAYRGRGQPQPSVPAPIGGAVNMHEAINLEGSADPFPQHMLSY